MSTAECTTYALDAGWLNEQSSNTCTVDNVTIYPANTITTVGTWWPYEYERPWYIWPSSYPVYVDRTEKIALKLSEIEQLRKTAKQSKKLKAILEKFTHLIEIEVDFD